MLEVLASDYHSFVGAVLLASFVAYLAWRNEHKARRAAACSKFRSVVLSSLSGLYPIPSDWPQDKMSIKVILREKFPSLQAAVGEFRPHVLPWKRGAFDHAWRTYRLGDDGREIDQQDYWQYVPWRGTGFVEGNRIEHDQTLSYKEDFKKNVARLLSFASET